MRGADEGPSRAVLLHQLGRSPDEVAIFSLPSPLLPWFALILGALLALLAQALIREGPVGAVLSVALFLGLFVALLFPRKLVVGDDGLLLIWIRARFVSYKAIEYVETSDGFFLKSPGINVALRSGSALDFSTSVFKERWLERDALLQLIRVAVSESAHKSAPRTPDALLRAGREPLVWANGLRALGAGANLDARTPVVPVEDLLRVAENPVAAPIDRAAAFVVLLANVNPDISSRLRFAVDHTAQPETRAALEGALDARGDEHAIAAVLALLESRSEKR